MKLCYREREVKGCVRIQETKSTETSLEQGETRLN